jgi:peptidoglycan/LPS O-acetylase OafA/YrhL
MNWNLRIMLMGGLLLVTLGPLLLLDNLEILYFRETTWPLLLVAVGVGLFLWNRRTLAGWIVGGIGIIFFVVNFVIFFFPGFEDWTFLVGPIILIIIGVLLLYRSYHDSRHPLIPRGKPPKTEEPQRAPESVSQDLRRQYPAPPEEEAQNQSAPPDRQPRQ